MTLAAAYDFRCRLVAYLETDLIGPATEHEELDEPPLDRYLTGILYPRREGNGPSPGPDLDPDLELDLEPDDDVDAVDEDRDVEPDPPVSLANRWNPSSMGLTFAVDTRATSVLRVSVAAGRYEELLQEDPAPGTRRRWFGGEGSGSRWRRIPCGWTDLTVPLDRPGDRRIPLEQGLYLFSRMRAPDPEGRVSVTMVVVNEKVAGMGVRDEAAYFQVQLEVRGASPTPALVPRPHEGVATSDGDVRSNLLLYRHAPVFAVGHGCSSDWKDSEHNRVAVVRTTYAPAYDLQLSDSNPAISTTGMSMHALATEPRRRVLVSLGAMVDGYQRWVEEQHPDVDRVLAGDASLQETAREHLAQAGLACERIRDGIELLRTVDHAWDAFVLANRAMQIQFTRSEWIREGSPPGGPGAGDDRHRWRPFQLAFILLNLPGIAGPGSEDRRLVDLLWFPTGGGKTEAYLGLIAFTIFLRRLRNEHGGGVTALMRYTLRLLTIQQFQRASLLITACESLRRQDRRLGPDPISIGLWVGRGATPLTREETGEALSRLGRGVPLDAGSPVQVHACPWCGRALGYPNYSLAGMDRQLVIACGNADCEFGQGLPIAVVDDDVYAQRPTLIIATVDKFASLPWRAEVSELFNIGHPEPPPELIIQDELHLIAGPLGTLTGLYETAVDELCTRDGVPPKIVASTATIRRAADQALALYGRQVRQFPPPGLDARDSYFAVERPATERGTRRYLGLSAAGVSQTTLMVRVYGALLQAAAEISGPDAARDPYWTLVGYFNSLRVLGAAELQVRDDVEDRIGLLAHRSGRAPRIVEQRIELTSREASSEIAKHLLAMSGTYPDEQALDVILATNMISVGVDIDRLGLMVVMGQPPTTAEYIQATSRVGRQHPGLVVTLLNPGKSRDRSHYEAFRGYHSALYRLVEATSVTPFSPRARDRALHAVLVALARQQIPELRQNDAAGSIASFGAALEGVIDRICARVEAVDQGAVVATRRHLREIADRWMRRASRPGELSFRSRDPAAALLGDAIGGDEGEVFPTMWSLRDVDAETHLYLE